MITLEHDYDGPYGTGAWTARCTDGRELRIEGPEAAILSLLLSGRRLREKSRVTGEQRRNVVQGPWKEPA